MRALSIPSDAPILAPAFDSQDDQFSSAFSLVRYAIGKRIFPAGSIAVSQARKLIALKPFGTLVFQEDLEAAVSLSPSVGQREDADFHNAQITPATLFDLASLTKPIATTTMAMILYERGLLELDAPIIGALPEFLLDSSGNVDPRRHEVTFRMLLAHSSGLPPYEKLFLKAQSREDLLNAAMTMPLVADPGTHAEYSDIGFIILGVALERLAQEGLETFCQREIFGLLSMTNTTFNPSPELKHKIPPTADERKAVGGAGAPAGEMRMPETSPSANQTNPRISFRDRIIQGEVQDENAWVLGGIAGHAGLFSTAEDIARFANVLLRGGSPILRQETISLFTRRDETPGPSRALGWDTPSNPSQSGKYFGPRSFGHLGYTGTSLWIDPELELSVTLLTNRTWPDCSNQAIKQFRPQFHDLVIESL